MSATYLIKQRCWLKSNHLCHRVCRDPWIWHLCRNINIWMHQSERNVARCLSRHHAMVLFIHFSPPFGHLHYYPQSREMATSAHNGHHHNPRFRCHHSVAKTTGHRAGQPLRCICPRLFGKHLFHCHSPVCSRNPARWSIRPGTLRAGSTRKYGAECCYCADYESTDVKWDHADDSSRHGIRQYYRHNGPSQHGSARRDAGPRVKVKLLGLLLVRPKEVELLK